MAAAAERTDDAEKSVIFMCDDHSFPHTTQFLINLLPLLKSAGYETLMIEKAKSADSEDFELAKYLVRAVPNIVDYAKNSYDLVPLQIRRRITRAIKYFNTGRDPGKFCQVHDEANSWGLTLVRRFPTLKLSTPLSEKARELGITVLPIDVDCPVHADTEVRDAYMSNKINDAMATTCSQAIVFTGAMHYFTRKHTDHPGKVFQGLRELLASNGITTVKAIFPILSSKKDLWRCIQLGKAPGYYRSPIDEDECDQVSYVSEKSVLPTTMGELLTWGENFNTFFTVVPTAAAETVAVDPADEENTTQATAALVAANLHLEKAGDTTNHELTK